MTTKLAGKNTYFLPFNQGSNGAGNDGGKGNPANPNGYPTAYLWENVFRKDSMMDIVQKFMNLKDGKALIFRAIISWMWCASCWPMSGRTEPGIIT